VCQHRIGSGSGHFDVHKGEAAELELSDRVPASHSSGRGTVTWRDDHARQRRRSVGEEFDSHRKDDAQEPATTDHDLRELSGQRQRAETEGVDSFGSSS
jgi:hypothetical protein